MAWHGMAWHGCISSPLLEVLAENFGMTLTKDWTLERNWLEYGAYAKKCSITRMIHELFEEAEVKLTDYNEVEDIMERYAQRQQVVATPESALGASSPMASTSSAS